MDQIFIKDLLIRGVIGISEREREQPQDILVNVVMEADIHSAGKSDNVEESVNYRTVAKKILTHVEKRWQLILPASSLKTPGWRVCACVWKNPAPCASRNLWGSRLNASAPDRR